VAARAWSSWKRPAMSWTPSGSRSRWSRPTGTATAGRSSALTATTSRRLCHSGPDVVRGRRGQSRYGAAARWPPAPGPAVDGQELGPAAGELGGQPVAVQGGLKASAIHGGPKSCVGAREGVGEALTGVHLGWAMEPRNQRFGVPTPYNQAEGNIDGRGSANGRRTLRGLRTCACAESPCARTGRPDGRPSAPMLPRPPGSRVAGRCSGGPRGKASGRKPSMNRRRESASRVVPAKLANNAGGPVAEPVEGRRLDKGNTDQQTAPRTQRRRHGASSALDRVRHLASRDRDARFTALLHHVGVDRLRAAYRALRPARRRALTR
jgi:hypothetical protein